MKINKIVSCIIKVLLVTCLCSFIGNEYKHEVYAENIILIEKKVSEQQEEVILNISVSEDYIIENIRVESENDYIQEDQTKVRIFDNGSFFVTVNYCSIDNVETLISESIEIKINEIAKRETIIEDLGNETTPFALDTNDRFPSINGAKSPGIIVDSRDFVKYDYPAQGIMSTAELMGNWIITNNGTAIMDKNYVVEVNYNANNTPGRIKAITIPYTSMTQGEVQWTSNSGASGIIHVDTSVGEYALIRNADLGLSESDSISSIQYEFGNLPGAGYSTGPLTESLREVYVESNQFAFFGDMSGSTPMESVLKFYTQEDGLGGVGSFEVSVRTSTINELTYYQTWPDTNLWTGKLTKQCINAGESVNISGEHRLAYYGAPYANTSWPTATSYSMVNPIFYLVIPQGMSFSNLEFYYGETNGLFSAGQKNPEVLDYDVEDITHLNKTNDGAKIYKITFPKEVIIGYFVDGIKQKSIKYEFDLTAGSKMLSKDYDVINFLFVTSSLGGKPSPSILGSSPNVSDIYNINHGIPFYSLLPNISLSVVSSNRVNLYAKDFTLSYDEAKQLTQGQAMGRADAVAIDSATNTAITGIEIDINQYNAIKNTSIEGGKFPLTFRTFDPNTNVTVEKMIYVTVSAKNQERTCQDDGYPDGWIWDEEQQTCIYQKEEMKQKPTIKPIISKAEEKEILEKFIITKDSGSTTVVLNSDGKIIGNGQLNTSNSSLQHVDAHWSIINLLITLISFVISLCSFSVSRAKNGKQGTIQLVSKKLVFISIILVLVNSFFLLITQTFSGKMVLMDKWTILFLISCFSVLTLHFSVLKVKKKACKSKLGDIKND